MWQISYGASNYLKLPVWPRTLSGLINSLFNLMFCSIRHSFVAQHSRLVLGVTTKQPKICQIKVDMAKDAATKTDKIKLCKETAWKLIPTWIDAAPSQQLFFFYNNNTKMYIGGKSGLSLCATPSPDQALKFCFSKRDGASCEQPIFSSLKSSAGSIASPVCFVLYSHSRTPQARYFI